MHNQYSIHKYDENAVFRRIPVSHKRSLREEIFKDVAVRAYHVPEKVKYDVVLRVWTGIRISIRTTPTLIIWYDV